MFSVRSSNQPKVTSTKEEIDLAVASFFELFPTSADCEEAICIAVAPHGVICECGTLLTNRNFAERTVRCTRCKKKNFVTADTFFHGVKKPVAYCLGTFLLSEGIAVSANYFAKCASVASSTGGVILHELSDVVMKNMDSAANVLTAKFREIIGKRSKETPAREHPFAEQAEEEKRAAERAKKKGEMPSLQPEIQDEPEGLKACGDLERKIYHQIRHEPVSLDSLSDTIDAPLTDLLGALTMLQLSGFSRALPGNKFLAIKDYDDAVLPMTKPASDKVRKGSLKHFFQYVRKTHHRISRKYAQRYAARYWCFLDRKRWTFTTLMNACAKSSRPSYVQLTSYVSPLAVKLAFPDTQ